MSPVRFFFNDTATTEIYTLSLHDALPIYQSTPLARATSRRTPRVAMPFAAAMTRSEEHTSELQSHSDLVCRLLLEKKNKQNSTCTSRRLRTSPDSMRSGTLHMGSPA